MSWQKTGKYVEKSAASGPMGSIKILFMGLLIMGVIGLGLNVVGGFFGWIGQAQQVAQEEFNPRAMLTKYEWFKNTASALAAKQQSIYVLEGRVKSLYEDYEGTKRKDWDRVDKQNMNIWRQETAGLKLSYNNLAAEWNSQIDKFHWRPFLGSLPPGAEQVLSSEFAPYQSN